MIDMDSQEKRSSKKPFERYLLLVLLSLSAVVILYVLSTQVREVLRPPDCQFYRFTGWFCPACGATRAMLHLVKANLKLAFKSNALAVLLVPFFIYALWLLLKSLFSGHNYLAKESIHPAVPWSVFVLILLFWLIRNLPAFSFLRPF